MTITPPGGIVAPSPDYMAGFRDGCSSMTSNIYAEEARRIAGSTSSYETLILWAAHAYSEEQQDAFNDAVDSMDMLRFWTAVQRLKQDHAAARKRFH